MLFKTKFNYKCLYRVMVTRVRKLLRISSNLTYVRMPELLSNSSNYTKNFVLKSRKGYNAM